MCSWTLVSYSALWIIMVKTYSWYVQVGFYHAGLDPKLAWNTPEMDGHVWYYRNFGNLWCGSMSAPETSAPGEHADC